MSLGILKLKLKLIEFGNNETETGTEDGRKDCKGQQKLERTK